MNEQTLRLLEKALLASPADWEMRLHLAEQYQASGNPKRAVELLSAATSAPETEEESLRKAALELKVAPDEALRTLQGILALNRASSPAYLLLARLYHFRGMP